MPWLPDPVSSFTGRGAVAVTPHHLATEAALDVMEEGGSAADAVIAANAVLGMVLPTTCGIGGDLFALVHHPGLDRPDTLNASGRAGSGASAAALRDAGHESIPPRSQESITVPGCVDGWTALSDRHGVLPFGRLLEPAIALGAGGFPTSPEFAADLERIAPLVTGQASAEPLYPGGAPPTAGTVLRRPDLAATLEAIASDGRDAFYAGRVAEAVSEATAGVLTVGDLAANRPDWVDAIGVPVFGLHGWTAPPNSQGYLTLAAAVVLEALDPRPDPHSPAFHHAVVEAYRAVAWERNRLVADPDHAPVPPEDLLDPVRLTERAGRISDHGVAEWPAPDPAPGGTAYFCAMDAGGMAVSAIQSNYYGIGSGIAAGDTGVFLHNRGAGFTLVPGHPNELAPGKRPLHTLSPTLWTRDGGCALILGTRGGHHQPQYLLQMAAFLLAAGLAPDEAQRMPRWQAEAGTAGSTLAVEAHASDEIVAGLTGRGHAVSRHDGVAVGWGPVAVVTVAPDGTRRAAADPRVSTASAGGA